MKIALLVAIDSDVQIRVWDSIFDTFVNSFATLDNHLAHPGVAQRSPWGAGSDFA